MAKKSRGPKAPTGRGKPIGPVVGVARAEQGVIKAVEREPHYHVRDVRGTPVKTLISTSVTFERIRLEAEMLALSAGSIGVGNVANLGITITPAQRRAVAYDHNGTPQFPDSRQITDDTSWEEMQTPGKLVVVSGFLSRIATASTAPAQYDFQPIQWGVADPDQHTSGRLAVPESALVLPAQAA